MHNQPGCKPSALNCFPFILDGRIFIHKTKAISKKVFTFTFVTTRKQLDGDY